MVSDETVREEMTESDGASVVSVPDGQIWYVDRVKITTHGDGDGTDEVEASVGITDSKFPPTDPSDIPSFVNPAAVDDQGLDNNTPGQRASAILGSYVYGGEDIAYAVRQDDGGTLTVQVNIRRLV